MRTHHAASKTSLSKMAPKPCWAGFCLNSLGKQNTKIGAKLASIFGGIEATGKALGARPTCRQAKPETRAAKQLNNLTIRLPQTSQVRPYNRFA